MIWNVIEGESVLLLWGRIIINKQFRVLQSLFLRLDALRVGDSWWWYFSCWIILDLLNGLTLNWILLLKLMKRILIYNRSRNDHLMGWLVRWTWTRRQSQNHTTGAVRDNFFNGGGSLSFLWLRSNLLSLQTTVQRLNGLGQLLKNINGNINIAWRSKSHIMLLGLCLKSIVVDLVNPNHVVHNLRSRFERLTSAKHFGFHPLSDRLNLIVLLLWKRRSWRITNGNLIFLLRI